MRMLLDLGELESGAPRVMCLKKEYGNGRRGKRAARELLRLTDSLIIMEEVSAGSGGLGMLLHGRYGRGFTVSIDLALPDRGHRATVGDVTRTPAAIFFSDSRHTPSSRRRPTSSYATDTSGVPLGGRGGGGSFAANAVARMDAATKQQQQQQQTAQESRQVQQAGQQAAVPQLHCYWCGALQAGPEPKIPGSYVGSWKSFVWDGQKRRCCRCCRTQAGKQQMGGARPTAALCPNGCAGCNW